MKLSKAEVKKNEKILELLKKDNLTYDDKCKVYEDLNEGYLGDVTNNSAYFTGLDLAMDFALMSPIYGTVVDMCAGFGVLSFAALTRDYNRMDIKKIILIERDPKYIEVGKKLVETIEREYYEKGETKKHKTEVIWVNGDVFDEQLWKQIENEHGKIDSIISNPPFGKVSKTGYDRSWLKYKGAELDIACIEIGLLKSESPSFILPQGSCTFRGSGRPYFEHCENRKIDKLKKDTGTDFYMSWTSIDTSVYEQNFKNTKITVECCTIDKKL